MNIVSTGQPILVIEDSDDDFEYTKRGLKEAGLTNPIIHCEDGQQALNYLERKEEFAKKTDIHDPGLILLDLNLPGIKGQDVLDAFKNHLNWKKIPVIILTTSDDPKDIDSCYTYGANSYIRKPVDIDSFFQAIRQLKTYWFDISILPKEGIKNGA